MYYCREFDQLHVSAMRIVIFLGSTVILSGVFIYSTEDKLRRTFDHFFRIASLSKA